MWLKYLRRQKYQKMPRLAEHPEFPWANLSYQKKERFSANRKRKSHFPILIRWLNFQLMRRQMKFRCNI